MTTEAKTEAPSRANVWQMFDRIAHRYDLLNRMLSFGRDVAWRKRLAKNLPDGDALRVLDLATGTGDLLFAMHEGGRVGFGRGLDLSEEMLRHGREKVEARSLVDCLELAHGDAMDIKEDDSSYDAVTISFGIRNVLDVDVALREMLRVLKPGGRVLILETSIPGNPIVRMGYLLYFRYILPFVGGLISGDRSAYHYLNKTSETFPYGQAFVALMDAAGFENARAVPLTFGVATLYIGERGLDV